MHSVVETPTYLADAKNAGVTEDERATIIATIAADPTSGDIIQGTGGARKLRIGAKGKGKSGGYRVIAYYAAEDVPIFLFALCRKVSARISVRRSETRFARSLGPSRTIIAGMSPPWSASTEQIDSVRNSG